MQYSELGLFYFMFDGCRVLVTRQFDTTLMNGEQQHEGESSTHDCDFLAVFIFKHR